jgi:hypothetical protein
VVITGGRMRVFCKVLSRLVSVGHDQSEIAAHPWTFFNGILSLHP